MQRLIAIQWPQGDAMLKRKKSTQRNSVFCCARAASGHVAAAPPTRPMNSRRLMGRPVVEVKVYHII